MKFHKPRLINPRNSARVEKNSSHSNTNSHAEANGGNEKMRSESPNGYEGRIYGSNAYSEKATGYQQNNGASGISRSIEGPGGRCTLGNNTRDMGNAPVVLNISEEAGRDDNFRTALWTGRNLQLTVMTIPVGGEIGLERHDSIDQAIGIISGDGVSVLGKLERNLNKPIPLTEESIVIIPAGTFHNVINTGSEPLKLWSIYAPKAHPFGTVDKYK